MLVVTGPRPRQQRREQQRRCEAVLPHLAESRCFQEWFNRSWGNRKQRTVTGRTYSVKECCVEASQLGHGRAAWSLAGAYSPATVNGLELSEEQLYALAKQLSEKWLESEPTDKDS